MLGVTNTNEFSGTDTWLVKMNSNQSNIVVQADVMPSSNSAKPVTHKILVIVPAYNESGNIQKTIEELKNSPLPITILVINDGSNDQTAEEAYRAGAFVVSLPFNLGIGGAVQTGFQFAVDKGFTLAVQVDGDGQHDIRYLSQLIDPVIRGQADMTIGSRFLPPYLGYQSSFVRRIGIHFFAWLISFLTRYKVTDPTSGFRAFNGKIIKAFAQYYPHDFPEPEAIMVARSLRARVQEMPVEMRKRQHGHSSIRYLRTLYYMVKVTFAILLHMIKKERTSLNAD